MKYLRIMLLAVCVVSTVECAAQKKVEYEFPANMALPIKAEYLKQCEKGRVLYTINCAGCHNTKVKGKIIIPDFSLDQLIGYELRVSNPDHENGMPETTVSAEELGLIMTFLNYKKKNTTVLKK